MSRIRNFSRNLTTSYLQLGVNVVYSLVSIPLILHWLPKAEFGLWMVLTQLMSYIVLVDLGVNQAIARFLIDHKDRRDTGSYGSLVKTSALVSVVQGLIILAVVTLGSPLLASMMKIQPEYKAVFISLMRVQGLIAAFNFCMNPLGIMLNAHQRADIISRQGMFNLTISLGFLSLFLYKNCGIYSFVYVNVITALITPCHLYWHCHRLGFLPQPGEWGKISRSQFKEVFIYGKDVFLVGLGAQLVTASQAIVISRTLGLEAAGVWVAGTKIFVLLGRMQFMPYSAAAAGLCEMVARGETERLRARFKNLVALSASLGVFFGVAFALCNSLFVNVWLGGEIVWSPLNDVLLGIWIFVTSIQMTHCNFVSITKQIGTMRYLYFVEGCSFVALSLCLGYRWGILGIIVCSDICVIIFSYSFGLRRSSQYFQTSFWDLTVLWVRPSLNLAAMLVPAAAILWFSTTNLPVIWRLAIHSIAVGLIGGFLFLRIGLPSEVLREIEIRLPRPLARFLRVPIPSEV